MGELKGRRIRLQCTLNDKKGTHIATPGSVLKVGDDVDEATAAQLLRGGSATVVMDSQGGHHG